ncbi:TBC1 domain family member 2A isoform X2 [Chiloscyllium plagiosum]|nr:TBC1 domain family member 2A isoform X2 [Chiloscyllium plagiosum]XP_043572329.1 TBC1 domain family member 2A isoform X2 [Chiloscyllium plagiosum]
MMADELEVDKPGPTAESSEELGVQARSGAAIEDSVELCEPDDLANYLEIKSEARDPDKKLCGYLNKLGGKGPLKGCKTRWFVYDQKTCHLYYFRTAQDNSPLGRMDLSKAAFNYCVEAEEGTFEISTPEKDYTLKAKNKDVMMYWLQQLQQKRWEHGEEQNYALTDDLSISTEHTELPPAFKTEEETDEFMDPVKTPTGLVGVEAASLPVPLQPTTLHNISLKHLGTEIQNLGSKTVFQFSRSKSFRESKTCFEEINKGPNETGQDVSQSKEGDISVKDSQEEEQKTPFRKSPRGSLKLLTNRFNNTTLPSQQDGNNPDKTMSLHNDILKLTNELNAQRELVKLLHRALEAAQQEKRACNSYLSADESTRLELVRHKVRQVRELESRVSALEKEKQEVEQSLRLQRDLVEELKQHAQLLMEKNNAKQEVILKLSEQMVKEDLSPSEMCGKVTAETMRKLEERIVHLMDDQEAYKTQNKFLNSEIYQVTKLWQATADREIALAMKCAFLKASYCQIESKYLTLLHKLQGDVNQKETNQDMVKQLIADQSKLENKAQPGSNVGAICNEYDEYGFKMVSSPVQENNLLIKIQALERKSMQLMATQESQEKTFQMKWTNYLSGRSFGEIQPSPELKNMIRNGVPKEYRRHVWKWCTDRWVRRIRECYDGKRYQELLKLCKNKDQAASKQIELDLHRTLTNNRLFTSPNSKMVQKLRRVLLAYSWQNPHIGYCQGLNRLAAIALLILREEEDAFWCLVAIIDCIMPEDYYSKTLTGSQVDQRVFKDFLSEKLPRLMSHFDQYNVDLSYITFNWFLVVFVDSLQSNILLKVWDAFLYEGTKVIFRYALAIFKYNEEEILKLNDNLAIYDYLRYLTQNISEGRKLMNIAFVEMNPFPLKLLRNRRMLHLEKLKAELSELERIREAYVKERVEQKIIIDCASEDEDEAERNRPGVESPEFSPGDPSKS